MFKKFLGDKAFYRRLLALMIPIMVQNGITNFVNMLDNIMIGTIGTAQMTGVAVANQLFFVFNLCIFGAVSGAGIFGAQFFGKQDSEGVKHTFRFKFIFCTLLTVLCVLLFVFFGEGLLDLYMQGESELTDPAATLEYAKSYMLIMLVGFLPYTITQCYSSTLREGSYANLPMIAGAFAVAVNLILNYLLIFGKMGFPALGVAGAATATVVSRFVELTIVVIATHTNKKYGFIKGVYKSFYVPAELVGKLFLRGLPLMINETLWASGVAVIGQCYSVISLDAVSAHNISQTFWNVFSIAFMAVGAAVGIILGQMLGAGKLKEAQDSSYKMLAFSFAISLGVGVVYFICANFIPYAYNTESEIRLLATRIMQISAVFMPFEALTHSSYFILRSGGKMLTTFIFDCGFMWCVNVVLAFVLSRYTSASFVTLFTLIQSIPVLKATLGIILIKRGKWVKNIIS